ncbi:MAG: hypothetical protein KAY24_07685, partial [Candidatus Eisenbacteria sp.]|nr:hypothetical protein [Candidatus Eisenbacteria bacterium]
MSRAGQIESMVIGRTGQREPVKRARWILVCFIGILAVLAGGCGREGQEDRGTSWWAQVTGVPGDSLGFEDRWKAPGAGDRAVAFFAHIASADLARLDFSPTAGGIIIIYNHGRTVQIKPQPMEEMPVHRTLFLTYMLPFLGRERLGETLIVLGIDTTKVTRGVEWEGHRCLMVGGTEAVTSDGSPEEAHPSALRRKEPFPAIYFDEETGAVLRLVTVSLSPLGRRVGDFRLYDHKLRRGAWLPTRFETWGSKGLRSRLDQIATGELGRV